MSKSQPSRRFRWRVMLRVLGVLLALALLLTFGGRLGAEIPAFAHWVEGLGVWGPVAYVLGYAVAPVAFAPGSLFTAMAGALFGLVRGTLYAFVGATLGSWLAFLVSRYLARGLVMRRLGKHPRLEAIDRAVSARGRRIVFLLRLSPVIPFNLLNYLLGLTRVGVLDYMLASIGMLPATLLYVYYGKLAGDVAALAGGVAVERDGAYYLLMGLGLLATLVVTVVVTRIARRALEQATETSLSSDLGESAERVVP